MHVHALQQAKVIHVFYAIAKLCIYFKGCVTALQTPFICMAFTLKCMLLFINCSTAYVDGEQFAQKFKLSALLRMLNRHISTSKTKFSLTWHFLSYNI